MIAHTGARRTVGQGTGSAYLTAPTGAHSVNWRHSLDQGKTWLSSGQTGVAHTTITGLPRGVEVYFEYQLVHATSVDPWSDYKTLMIT